MKRFIKYFLLSIFILPVSLTSAQESTAEDKANYVFLFIGDGMGVAQVNAAEAYLAAVNGEAGFHNLTFTRFPATGYMSTFAGNRFITGSAASGTALATGYKTNISRISMDPDGVKPFKTIAERSKEMGMKVGIVSNVSIDHATPAVFYAHQPKRSMYFEIGYDLVQSDFDFFGGGGFIKPQGTIDGVVIDLMEEAGKYGFTVVNTRDGFNDLDNTSGRAIAISPRLDKNGAMPYTLDMMPDDLSLADFTVKAIELLNNEAGFFIMVEGGKIDWACHANDGACSVQEVIALDKAIEAAFGFYEAHPQQTLIVVTADHETGGMGLGNNTVHYDFNIELLKYQKSSNDHFSEIVADFREKRSGNDTIDLAKMLEIISNDFGLGHKNKVPLTEEDMKRIKTAFYASMYPGDDSSTNLTYGGYEPLTITLSRLLNEKAGIGWSTYSHTGVNVPVYAIGVGAEKFSGTIDNTDIPKIIESVMR